MAATTDVIRYRGVDAPELYWRIQDAGYALSRSHRSETWGEDDEPEVHAGTSVVRTPAGLAGVGPNLYGTGDIELLCLTGREVGVGWDGEPVVIPEREIARWVYRGPDHDHVDAVSRRMAALMSLRRCTGPADVARRGWVRVQRMAVVD